MTVSNEMNIDWDVAVPMDDGTILRADVFRPKSPGEYPVILNHGVYGKGVPIDRFRHRLHKLADSLPDHVIVPDVADAVGDTSENIVEGDYRVWEAVDPAAWVPRGYVCIRVDSRGSGQSAGRLDPVSQQEISDFAACIEWAGTQEWSNGKVGLCGKSYYAMSQWLVAARQPRHLAAICVWHGWSDWYRDATRHGGILYQFWEKFWYPQLALPVQHGVGAPAGTNPHSGLPVAGSEMLAASTLEDNRADLVNALRQHPFDDDYYWHRTPLLDRVEVPVLASADWSDHDLHLRGTISGFLKATSPSKWLEVHAGGQFDDETAVTLQQRFFDYHLKGVEQAWCDQPKVQLTVRKADGTSIVRNDSAWPLPGTTWHSFYVDLANKSLTEEIPERHSQASYKSADEAVTLETDLFIEDTTIIGHISASLWISSSTPDADLFLVLNAVDSSGKRVELRDHRGGLTPMSVGWLRASHRALDLSLSTPQQPYHPHDKAEPLVIGEICEVQIELRPTSLQIQAGCRLQLTISGQGKLHNDHADRPHDLFTNAVTLHGGPDTPARLLIPVVPAEPTIRSQDDTR